LLIELLELHDDAQICEHQVLHDSCKFSMQEIYFP